MIEDSSREDYLRKHRASGIKVGDEVMVLRIAYGDEQGWNCFWVDSMNDIVGGTYKVGKDGGSMGFIIVVGGNRRCWVPYFILDKAGSYGKGVLVPIEGY